MNLREGPSADAAHQGAWHGFAVDGASPVTACAQRGTHAQSWPNANTIVSTDPAQ